MKNILILALMLFAAAVTASAQSPTRIRFDKGKSSATVKGSTGSYGVTYVIRARSGQKLILNLAPAKQVGIRVDGNGADRETVLLREERGGTYEIGLEESGDYTIFVGSTSGKPVPFTLTVRIGKLADI